MITSAGRAFPVETHYRGRDPALRIEEDVAGAIVAAHRQEAGSILAFLPGQGEITRVAAHLEGRLGAATDIVTLFGALDRAAQDRAIAPAGPGRRKVVLATSIAETSLTIEGVRVVVDSGLARVPRFEPDMGLTRLETVRVSRAGADQRRGRAGRTEPGICFRMWEEAGTGAMQPFARPEILDADLAGLLLDLAVWGTRDPAELRWLDPPPAAATAMARGMLEDLGALDASGAITDEGRRIAALATPPRLARAILSATRLGAPEARRGRRDFVGGTRSRRVGKRSRRTTGPMAAGPLGAGRGGPGIEPESCAPGPARPRRRAPGRRGRSQSRTRARARLSGADREVARSPR